MKPRPKADDEKHRGCAKLRDKVAIITGGDSGIGRAVAIAFAKEDADVAVVYLEEEKDAKETRRLVEQEVVVGRIIWNRSRDFRAGGSAACASGVAPPHRQRAVRPNDQATILSRPVSWGCTTVSGPPLTVLVAHTIFGIILGAFYVVK
jgi:short chain dehydrogenase